MAYGPEAIVIVLAAAATVGLAYTLPVTVAIVALLAVLVISYRQVIEAFPNLYPDRVWLCLGVLAVITAANMWGVAESARLFIVPTLIFILAIAVVIVGGLIRSGPSACVGGS